MKLHSFPCTLQLRHAFGIASNTRTSTPAMIVELTHDGVTGYGEAAMPSDGVRGPASGARKRSS